MSNTLLILDDAPEVARAMRRVLTKSFQRVVIASSPGEAERLLSDRNDPPTHLVCDQYLGEGHPLGSDLVRGWRQTYPNLRVAVLVTGSEIDLLVPIEGVDWIVTKPIDAHELVEMLLGERPDT